MSPKFIAKESMKNHPSGMQAVWFGIYEVVVVDGEERFSPSADMGFKTRQEAEAWIAANSDPE